MIARIEDWIVRRLLFAGLVTTRHPGPGILLTFDDGPLPGSTDAVLDLLAGRGWRGVFFAVGRRIRANPELAHRIVAEGHVLGCHSWTHRERPFLDVRGEREELQLFLEETTRLRLPRPALYRPPEGLLTVARLLAARSAGLRIVHWSREARDWEIREARRARDRGFELAGRVTDGDVVLFHDGAEHAREFLQGFVSGITAREAAPPVVDPEGLLR